MTEAQLATCDRLLLGIEQIANAVQRLNDLGGELGVPRIFIRFQPSPLIYGQNPYSNLVNSMMCAEYERRIQLMIESERLAA